MDYAKKGQMSSQKKSQRQLKSVTHKLGEPPAIGKVPPSERTPYTNNYAKVAKDRKNKGDVRKNEKNTDSYANDTYLRFL